MAEAERLESILFSLGKGMVNVRGTVRRLGTNGPYKPGEVELSIMGSPESAGRQFETTISAAAAVELSGCLNQVIEKMSRECIG